MRVADCRGRARDGAGGREVCITVTLRDVGLDSCVACGFVGMLGKKC